jgi:hypothetical protein
MPDVVQAARRFLDRKGPPRFALFHVEHFEVRGRCPSRIVVDYSTWNNLHFDPFWELCQNGYLFGNNSKATPADG